MGSTTDNAPPSSTTSTAQQTTGTEPEPAAPGVLFPNPSADSSSASAPTPMIAAPESPTTEKQDNVETAPQPVLENVKGGTGRQLSVTDALSYLDAIKVQLHDRPDCYNLFLDIMKDFTGQV